MENLCTVGGNVNGCYHCRKQYGDSTPPQKIKIEIPYDPVIPLLGIYPKKMKTLIWKDICTPMFTAVLFTVAKYGSSPSVHW